MSKIIISFPKNILKSTFTKLSTFELPPRLKGGFIENSVNYVRNVFLDYKAVYVETLQDIRHRPLKSSIIFSILFSGAYLIKHNPNLREFEMQLIDSSNRISRVQQSIRNQNSLNYIHEIFQMHNKQLLRHQSFGLFSIIYKVEYSPENDLYLSKCKYLQPTWKERLENIVDIGALDRFWCMHYKMKDYDINDNEWKN